MSSRRLFVRRFVPLILLVWAVDGSAGGTAAPYELVAESAPLCRPAVQFLNGAAQGQPNFQNLSEAVQWRKPHLPSPLDGVPLVDFDFDNDGQADQVFISGRWSRYIAGTLIYVRHAQSSQATANSPAPMEELKIYPCQFDPRSKGPAHCPPRSQDGDEMGIDTHFPSKGVKIFFRGRYTEISPVRYHERTYLLLKSQSADTERYAALIEPLKNDGFRSVCLFRRVK